MYTNDISWPIQWWDDVQYFIENGPLDPWEDEDDEDDEPVVEEWED